MASTVPLQIGDLIPHKRFDLNGAEVPGPTGKAKNVLFGVLSFKGDYPNERLSHSPLKSFVGTLPVTRLGPLPGSPPGSTIFYSTTPIWEYTPGTAPTDVGNLGFPSLSSSLGTGLEVSNSGTLLRGPIFLGDFQFYSQAQSITANVSPDQYPKTLTIQPLYAIDLFNAPGAKWQWIKVSAVGTAFEAVTVLEEGVYSTIHGVSGYSGKSVTLTNPLEQFAFRVSPPGDPYLPVQLPRGKAVGDLKGPYYFDP